MDRCAGKQVSCFSTSSLLPSAFPAAALFGRLRRRKYTDPRGSQLASSDQGLCFMFLLVTATEEGVGGKKEADGKGRMGWSCVCGI